jgi:hypothetical protein
MKSSWKNIQILQSLWWYLYRESLRERERGKKRERDRLPVYGESERDLMAAVRTDEDFAFPMAIENDDDDDFTSNKSLG